MPRLQCFQRDALQRRGSPLHATYCGMRAFNAAAASVSICWDRSGLFSVHRSFSVQRPFRERSLGVAPLLRPLSEGLIPARQGALQASKEGDIAWPGGVHLPRLDSVQEPLERFGGLLDSCLGWGTARGCHDPHILHRSHDEKGEWVERAEVPWAMMGP